MDKNTFFSRMKQRAIAYKTEIKSLKEEERKKKYFELGMEVLVALFLSFFLSGFVMNAFAMLFTGGKPGHGIIYFAMATPVGWMFSLFFFFAMIFFLANIEFRRNLNNGELLTDKRGVTYMRNGTAGTSRFMNENEMHEKFYVGDILDTDETVYGQLTDMGKEVVAFKKKESGATGNKNLLLLGSPGTGKSYCYVRTEIIQSALRGSSIIVTDPSGELYTTVGEFLRNNGYDVQILNLVDPRYSNFWNCMEEVIDPETERLDSTRLNDFTEIYMANVGEVGAKKDQFWSDGAINLLRAVIGHTSWSREIVILNEYRNLYAKVSKDDPNKDKILEHRMVDMCSFAWCKELILKNAEQYGFDVDEIKEEIKDIEEKAPKFTIAEVFNDLENFEDITSDFADMPLSHPGVKALKIFMGGTDTIKASTLLGTKLKFQIFADNKLCSMLSNKGIDIQNINKKKSAYFIAMNEKSNATRPISSLFFSFFFKDAMENFDKCARISESEGIPNPCYPVSVILDEFFSIGVIGGNPDWFAQQLSVCRKRLLGVSIIVQSIPQINERYGEYNANTIQTCCDYVMFLGCNDPETAKFISEFISGDATVLSERHAESLNPLGTIGDGSNMMFTSVNRKVLTVDEARRWPVGKVLLAKRGELPAELKAFPWDHHPCYLNGEINHVSVYKVLKPIEERLDDITAVAKDKKPTDISFGMTNIPKIQIKQPVTENKKDTVANDYAGVLGNKKQNNPKDNGNNLF